MFKETV
jgi:hypothetical protein